MFVVLYYVCSIQNNRSHSLWVVWANFSRSQLSVWQLAIIWTRGFCHSFCCRDPTLRLSHSLPLSHQAVEMSEAGFSQWGHSPWFFQSRLSSNGIFSKRKMPSRSSMDMQLTQDRENCPDLGCGFITFGHKSRLVDFTPVCKSRERVAVLALLPKARPSVEQWEQSSIRMKWWERAVNLLIMDESPFKSSHRTDSTETEFRLRSNVALNFDSPGKSQWTINSYSTYVICSNSVAYQLVTVINAH